MLKIFRYLKPYIPGILLAIVLLFLRVNFELSLPDYMSRIMNIGLQQGGIEEPVPPILMESQYQMIISQVPADEAAPIKNAYTQIVPGSDDGKFWAEQYPAIADDSYYVLSGEIPEDTLPILQKLYLYSAFSTGVIEISAEQQQALQAMSSSGSSLDSLEGDMLNQVVIQIIQMQYEQSGFDTLSLQNRYIVKTGGIMLLVTLLAAAATILVGYIASQIAAKVSMALRRDIFTKVEGFSSAEFDSFSTASLITRSTNDITKVQNVIMMGIRMMFYAPIMGVGGVIRAIGKAPSMAWMIGLAVVVLLGTVLFAAGMVLPKFRKIQKLIDRLNLVAREGLSGVLVIRAFNKQQYQEDRFDKVNTDVTRVSLFVNRVMGMMMPFIILIMNVLSIAIIWVGAEYVSQSLLQVGDLMAFLQYVMQIVMSFLMLSMLFIFLPRASVSAERINEVLQKDPSITDPESPAALPAKVQGKLTFDNVSFRYPGGEEDAIQNISFTARPGTTTAFIGATGSGKSTVAKLVPRLYDVTGGEIRLDGIDIRQLKQSDLHDQIGYVPQKSNLFTGTVKSNIQYGNMEADDSEIAEAVKTAQGEQFIAALPEKYEAPVSQGGSNFSGGQKQRLSIARALAKNYPIFVFDDSFSALDFKTDRALRGALKEKTGESTILVVAQRVSTIMNADNIIVLDNGKIIGQGNHDQLMKSCSEYREIAKSQLNLEDAV